MHLIETLDEALVERFNAAMRDDFNTPEAIAVLFEINKELNRAMKENAEQAAIYYATLRHLTNILGLVQQNVGCNSSNLTLVKKALGLSPEQIEDLIRQRTGCQESQRVRTCR